jgi:hypothetical protein
VQASNNVAILRLTALWGLTESGLGGWMHALHLPLTGIFVGGAATVIIALIAWYSRFSFRQVMQATLLVMLVKFTASPQSPPQAYVAVGFQGLAGAVLYRLIPGFTIASVLFGVLAMFESAVQKLIFMTLIYGRSLWEALDEFFEAIVKDFSLSASFSFSYWVISAYISLYVIWGLLLGIWIARLPRRIDVHASDVNSQFREFYASAGNHSPAKGKRRKNKTLPILLMLFFVAGVFLLQGSIGKAEYVILRTVAALLLILGIINPLLRKAMQTWLNKSKSKHKESLQSVLDLQPELIGFIRPAYRLAAARHTGLKRYSAFLFILIAATLHPIHESAQDIHIHKPRS